jgi:REP element-mobilizing transposase RayT
MHKNHHRPFDLCGVTFFVTITTYNFETYFADSLFCELFIEELRLCRQFKGFELHAFCILHDHVHLLITTGDKFCISEVMQSLKKEFSRDINQILVGDIPECRLQGKQYSRRFNVKFIVPNFKKYIGGNCKYGNFKWQKSFHDHVIRNEVDFNNHWRYTTYNYVKHGLPNDWKYTSQRITGI